MCCPFGIVNDDDDDDELHSLITNSNLVTITTIKPCCRRESPRDAGHLYRKLLHLILGQRSE